ncbi:hypothetical protein A5730_03145 [Mycobacterium sp. ACS4054]|uniref:DUF3592 domain-containing protein n=1 Tax=Mycobacterium sp. ACS4054 TaxID=1834119 RepID=UPI0007FCF5B4|nr:DUF3592 domain-containing protein [Mycobacterium sp. ACS4054]OBF12563.1 hypothetical protein A5730_03145 [Mycobacterium sp. ACS4054]
MAVKILALIISCAAIAAGWAYVRTARRMSSFATTRGTVVRREVTAVPVLSGREGRWGKGGGYQPTVTYTYVVDGVAYTSDRWGYATQGLKRSQAEQALAAVPDEVDVHYDPSAPHVAYLHTHTSRIGYALIAGGAVGVVLALASLLT